jgi:hypothetical protein
LSSITSDIHSPSTNFSDHHGGVEILTSMKYKSVHTNLLIPGHAYFLYQPFLVAQGTNRRHEPAIAFLSLSNISTDSSKRLKQNLHTCRTSLAVAPSIKNFGFSKISCAHQHIPHMQPQTHTSTLFALNGRKSPLRSFSPIKQSANSRCPPSHLRRSSSMSK